MIEVRVYNENNELEPGAYDFNLDSTTLEVEKFEIGDVLRAMLSRHWKMPPGRMFFAARVDDLDWHSGILFIVPEHITDST